MGNLVCSVAISACILGGVKHRLTAPSFAMAYNLTSDELVQRSMGLGDRSLLARRSPGTSPPQVARHLAPQATGTLPPQVDRHIAPQIDRHIAHQPTAMCTAQFSQLMSFINVHGVGITQEAWHSKFGVISEEYPWGAGFWNGFTSLMATDYLPCKMSHLRIDAFRRAYFTLPLNFSKSAAQAPQSGLNPASSSQYPCFIAAFVYQDPWYEAVCIHMAIRCVKPWRVHKSWLRLID